MHHIIAQGPGDVQCSILDDVEVHIIDRNGVVIERAKARSLSPNDRFTISGMPGIRWVATCSHPVGAVYEGASV